MKKTSPGAAVMLLLAILNAHLAGAHAQGTAFTYQGRLNAGSAPADGSYDLSFALYPTNLTGSVLAGPVTNVAVAVTNGVFTTLVDFGGVFTGASNWLQIAVSTNAANAFTTLAPRQQLTPVPYAILAGNVSGVVSYQNLPGFQNGNNYNALGGGSGNAFNGFYGWNTIAGGQNNQAGFEFSFVGGGSGNNASGYLSTVGGGNYDVASGQYSFVGGGENNRAAGDNAVVAGGYYNLAYGTGAFIGGGGTDGSHTTGNLANGPGSVIAGGAANYSASSASDAVIGGGFSNTNGASCATVGGGTFNTASGNYATVPGGTLNTASGFASFAAGSFAQATNFGSFVWADGQVAPFTSTSNNQFSVRASGGVRLVTSGAGLNLDGGITATTFAGSGANLTSLNASTLSSGTVPMSQLPATVVTNNEMGVTLGGAFSGNGNGLTNVNAYNFAPGTGLFIQPGNATNGAPNVLAGAAVNYVSNGIIGATISGGGATNFFGIIPSNSVTGDFGTVGGGGLNTAGLAATVGGGSANDASGDYAAVGGGASNQATNHFATVPGGRSNVAGGQYSFAAGDQAQALHQGAFVWADSQSGAFASTTNDQFNVRAQGGVRLVTAGAGLIVDGQPALLNGNGLVIQQNTNNQPNLIGGSSLNFVSNGVAGATISGGGNQPFTTATPNSVTASFGTVGGGAGNTAGGVDSVVSGGLLNTANGPFAMVPGGVGNLASGNCSFAAGYYAQALHQGAFVWADSQNRGFASTANDQFNVRAQGGVRLVTSGAGLSVDAPVTASAFSGNGSGLTGLNASQLASGTVPASALSTLPAGSLTGTVAFSNLPGAIVTNLETGVTLAGTFAGSGAGLTGLNASQLASGVVPTSVLPGFQTPNFQAIGGGFGNSAGYAATVAGGNGNNASGSSAAIGGGYQNTASGAAATVAGGYSNAATNADAVVAGGSYNTAGATNATVGGGLNNTALGKYAFIGGGYLNTVTNDYAVIGGGSNNIADGLYSVVAGGSRNTALGMGATVGGGGPTFIFGDISTDLGYGLYIDLTSPNTAHADYSTVCGGSANTANGTNSTIGGGAGNVTTPGGFCSMIPGGFGNSARGDFSFAAGYYADANADGSFVWGCFDPSVRATALVPNSFVAVATGGFVLATGSGVGVILGTGSGSWSSVSDRNVKTNITTLDPAVVLNKVAQMPVSEWSYKTEHGVRHVGPMAQDFYAAFHVGPDDKHIAEVDEGGVALAAIQGLNKKLEAKSDQLEAENAELKQQLAELKALVQKLGQRE
jgi:hypothetical protein